MSQAIPEDFLDLFTEKRAFAHLATVMDDGTPQVTPIWIDYDGTYVLINSAKGRVKDKNLEARPHVAIEVSDPDDPYRYIAIRGRVVEITEEGAVEHIDKLAYKYTGEEKFANRHVGTRRIYKIIVDHVTTTG